MGFRRPSDYLALLNAAGPVPMPPPDQIGRAWLKLDGVERDVFELSVETEQDLIETTMFGDAAPTYLAGASRVRVRATLSAIDPGRITLGSTVRIECGIDAADQAFVAGFAGFARLVGSRIEVRIGEVATEEIELLIDGPFDLGQNKKPAPASAPLTTDRRMRPA